MLLKDLYKSIQEEIEKDPSILELEVQIQVEYDKYYDCPGLGVGHMEDDSFIVEEFNSDPVKWLKEMGSDCTSLKQYMEEEDPRMRKVFYIKSTS